jgi:tetratricopeptide (TPR) repeat protein
LIRRLIRDPGVPPARGFLPAACLLGAILLASCAGVQPVPTPSIPPPVAEEAPPTDPFREFPDTIRGRARDAETRGDLRKSLFLWKVILRFVPGDDEGDEMVRTLSVRLKSAADAHFRKGVERYKAGESAAARREFLLVLANDPDHAGARDYLKNRMAAPDVVTYETREGDTLRRIAKERYNDPDRDGMIAYLNDLDKNAPLRPGTLLRFPVPDESPALEGAEKPGKDILNYSRETDLKEAERLYRSGIRQFQAGELEKAAADWEKTLRFDPEHAKARKDLDRVRRMLDKLK